ncbi:MAG: hypothetical protein YFSK_3660 [Candidatus Yanofskyibacterium parasiticum]|jgi:hypothetical protein|nr:MAG: hypothetical protein YFSK_3660 [Candidatus Yanofskybacteria bacterium]
MKKNFSKNQAGYVALVSAILVSGVMMALAVSVSRAAFWGRFDALARENKIVAREMAKGCAEQALLKISKNEEPIVWEMCSDLRINADNDPVYEIIARADWKNSFARLRIVAERNGGEIKILQWEEF